MRKFWVWLFHYALDRVTSGTIVDDKIVAQFSYLNPNRRIVYVTVIFEDKNHPGE